MWHIKCETESFILITEYGHACHLIRIRRIAYACVLYELLVTRGQTPNPVVRVSVPRAVHWHIPCPPWKSARKGLQIVTLVHMPHSSITCHNNDYNMYFKMFPSVHPPIRSFIQSFLPSFIHSFIHTAYLLTRIYRVRYFCKLLGKCTVKSAVFSLFQEGCSISVVATFSQCFVQQC